MVGEAVPGYAAPRDRPRWVPARNIGTETIPGWAIVMIDPSEGADFMSAETVEQQLTWRVRQCNDEGESLGDPGLFAFNGPTPIRPGTIGKVTQDTPAQVLHNGSEDGLPNGFLCGPRSGKWSIVSGGGSFVSITHDPTWPDQSTRAGLHTIWVGLAGRKSPASGSVIGTGTVDVQERIPFGERGFEVEGAGGAVLGFNTDALTDQSYGLFLDRPGVWWVQFSATISSVDADDGEELRIRAFLDGTQTYLKGSRTHVITTGAGILTDSGGDTISSNYFGGSPIYSAENVAFGGPLYVSPRTTAPTYRELDIRNVSSSAIVVTDAILSAFWLGLERIPPRGGSPWS